MLRQKKAGGGGMVHARDSGAANSALCDVRTEDFGSSDVLAGVVPASVREEPMKLQAPVSSA
ncbi:MAG: hypothetical protein ACLTK0_06615 [Anaerovoracaceae bacterium]